MKKLPSLLTVVAFVIWPALIWSADGDYSLEYSAIDISGGAVSGAANPVEDIITADLQGLCNASSDTYTVTSVLCWPGPVTAASNWTVYE